MTTAVEAVVETREDLSQEDEAPTPPAPRTWPVFAAMWAALILLTFFSLLYGRYNLPWQSWWRIFAAPDSAGLESIVLLQVRLPRVLAAILIVSVWTPLTNADIASRWFSWPNVVFLSPVPIVTALVAYGE